MKHKEVFMLPNAKFWLKRITLQEISNVTGVVYHRILSLISCQKLHPCSTGSGNERGVEAQSLYS